MPHADILDQPDSLRKPLLASAAFHASVVALAIAYMSWMTVTRESWGSNVAGGGAVEVGSVRSIPLPGRTGRVNPLANDTESQIPERPPEKKVEKRVQKPQPDAIPLWRDKPMREQRQQVARRNMPQQTWRDNQLYSSEGEAAVSQMYHMPGGGGSIGVGPGVFGQRFGAYAALIIQRIADRWQTSGLDPRMQQSALVVTFDLRRDGSIGTPVVMQRSGNYSIDTSAIRAIVQAAPFPPLPPGAGGNSTDVQLTFKLR